jgi:CheY-like chemotaxis protein
VARILVVDDEPDVRELFNITLKMAGHETDTAKHGQEAVERLATETPDLIVLDLMMPHMDGFAFLNHVRTQMSTKPMRVLVATAKVLEEVDQERLGNWPVVGVLNKGELDIGQMVLVVTTALGKSPMKEGGAAAAPSAPEKAAGPAQPTPSTPEAQPVISKPTISVPSTATPQPSTTIGGSPAPSEAAPASQPAPSVESTDKPKASDVEEAGAKPEVTSTPSQPAAKDISDAPSPPQKAQGNISTKPLSEDGLPQKPQAESKDEAPKPTIPKSAP